MYFVTDCLQYHLDNVIVGRIEPYTPCYVYGFALILLPAHLSPCGLALG